MPAADADRNLLFGILALQMDFISRDVLIRAMHAWVLEKSKSLGQVLVEQNALGSERHALLEALVRERLRQHGNDAVRSLAAVSSLGPVADDLRQITDPDLGASLIHLAVTQMRDPGVTQPTPVPTTNAPNYSGGRFRIIRPHARGGLGEVFVARDEELNREVALKEMQARHADDPDSRARFVLEAEVTGGLEHPGIVPVYGLGQYADGRPYYAMRFIRGDSLDEAISRFHKADLPGRDPSERALALRQLLGRFVDICEAIAYAHNRGVLHRDLKPGNIMLGKYGETLVVDWGLAKTLGAEDRLTGHSEGPFRAGLSGNSVATQMGAAVGTPQYMSPEQAAGRWDEVGPASDVYSLGATLYALLTGKVPVEGSALGDVLKRVHSGDFPPPRQVKPQVPPALDAVCLKAMALKPEDRYPSARALADDLEHWLADEPVAVYRDPTLGRAARWGRRHRTLVAGLAGLLVTAVVALAVSTVLIAAEQARTVEQRRQADANFQTALAAVNDMLTEVAQEQLANEPRMAKKQRALLAKARTYYQQFLDQRGNDQRLRKETALAHKRLGDISRLLEENEQAREAYGDAIALLRPLAEANPGEPDYRDALAQSFDYLGEVLRATSRTGEAEEAYRQALAIQEPLAQEFLDRPEYRKEQACTYNNLGLLYRYTQQYEESEKAFNECIRLLSQLAAERQADPGYRRFLARAYLNLGPVLRATGHADRAEALYGQAIRLQTDLVRQDPWTPDYRFELAISQHNLGYLLERAGGRDKEAEKAYREALKLLDPLVVQFPDVPVYRKQLAITENTLANVVSRTPDRRAEAAEHWQRALDLFDQLAAANRDMPDYEGSKGMVLGNLGWLRLQQHDLKRARELLEEATHRVQVALKANADNPDYLRALRDEYQYLYETLTQQGDPAGAANYEKLRDEVNARIPVAAR
jgi:serine/threonine-protein kinase